MPGTIHSLSLLPHPMKVIWGLPVVVADSVLSRREKGTIDGGSMSMKGFGRRDVMQKKKRKRKLQFRGHK